MKVIDILNKIANGEETPHFKVGELEYFLNWRGNLLEREEGKQSYDTQWFIDKEWLNTKVEIIEEEKKIKRLATNLWCDEDKTCKREMNEKINEIIDYLNKESK